MYEREIGQLLEDGIAKFTAKPKLLTFAIQAPGWTDAETAKVVTAWQENPPTVRYSLKREAGEAPNFAIVLAQEAPAQQYLGDSANAMNIDEVAAVVTALERQLGEPIDVSIEEFQLTYQVFVFAENPDVTIAYANALRSILLAAKKTLARAGFQRPSYSMMDLAPESNYLPDSVYARAVSVSGYAHVLTADGLFLGPWATGRAKRIIGLHVNNHVGDVVAAIEPNVE